MSDTKLSDLPELAAAPAATDEIYVRDVSEVAGAESKRLTITNLFTSPTLVTPVVDQLAVNTSINMEASTLFNSSNGGDDREVIFRARDNGVGLVEVARLQGAAEPRFAHTRPVNVLGAAAAELTIAAGAITIIAGFNTVDTEGDAATDSLDTISGGRTGDIYIFAPAIATRTVVAKHGTGNLNLAGGVDFTMDEDDDFLMLLLVGTVWQEINRSENHA